MRFKSLGPLSVALMLLLAAGRSFAEQPQATAAAQKPQFMRFVEDGHGGGKLETAVVDYRNPKGVVVHLVAAIHIADASYYAGLNKLFKGYDAVLYEMVKPRNAPPPKPGEERTGNLITMIQRFMKDTLDLRFQLDEINYTAPNFVHADLDYETFEKMESARGESIWSLMLQQMLKEMANPPADQQQIGAGDLFAALTSPDRARQLKLIIGRQFGDIEDQMSSFGGTVLITERNKACFKVLDQQIAAGKRNLGIFYGAGHMGDMEKRLLAMGFHRTGLQWRVGWDLTAGASENHAAHAKDPAIEPGTTSKPRPRNGHSAANNIEKILYTAPAGR